uniref:Secreted protein n=1 Tax=Pavo cristatus TaxID=9049 RepID=A0A8C9F5X8_PAVCR
GRCLLSFLFFLVSSQQCGRCCSVGCDLPSESHTHSAAALSVLERCRKGKSSAIFHTRKVRQRKGKQLLPTILLGRITASDSPAPIKTIFLSSFTKNIEKHSRLLLPRCALLADWEEVPCTWLLQGQLRAYEVPCSWEYLVHLAEKQICSILLFLPSWFIAAI